MGRRLAADLCALIDKRNTFSSCDLSAQIRPVHPQCCTDDAFSPQKVSFAIRARHSAIQLVTRCRGSSACRARPSHFKMSSLPHLHQSFRLVH